ncbi:MAG: hypothetical protein K6G51_00935 [Sphaerochaetaceae bacterium]|nr:hypothetical protein [Sphaerochaetaceae bacterium]
MSNISRKLKRLNEKLETFEPYEVDSMGRRVIRLHVNDADTFLSPLSIEGVPVISDETAYLLNFYLLNMTLNDYEEIVFVISGRDFSDLEKNIYRKAIKNYYQEEFLDTQDQIKENLRSALWMLFIGILFLVANIALKYTIPGALLNSFSFEFIDIIAWVFIWESVVLLFRERPQLQEKQIQHLEILEAKFYFKDKVLPEDNIPFTIQKLEEYEDEIDQ